MIYDFSHYTNIFIKYNIKNKIKLLNKNYGISSEIIDLKINN